MSLEEKKQNVEKEQNATSAELQRLLTEKQQIEQRINQLVSALNVLNGKKQMVDELIGDEKDGK